MSLDVSHLSKLDDLLENLKYDDKVKEVAPDIYGLFPETTNPYASSVALTAITHGDEIIGLPLFQLLLEEYLEGSFTPDAPLYLIIANRDAYRKKQRYVETDLNRAYGENSKKCLEHKRASIIKPIIDRCDYSIDIHQCIEETLHPFFLLPYSAANYSWVKNVVPEIPTVIRKNVTTATTLSSYAFLQGKKAVTFEVGSHGVDEKQLNLGMSTIKRFLAHAWKQETVFDNNIVTNQSSLTYEIKYFQGYQSGQVRFEKKFSNFERVNKGQIIAYVDDIPTPSPISGKILLYPSHWFLENSTVKPDGIFVIVQELKVIPN